MLNPFKPRTIATTLLVTAVLVAAAYIGIRRTLPQFPYGRSHCCDKQLMFALLSYADRHGGWFPKGESTAEAALSLLHRDAPESVDPNLLRGKTVPESVVRARLARGELLTPETCGWHYVDGLHIDDDPRLALFWDKEGLGHNGELLPDGGHYVCLVSGIKYIPGSEWQTFLAEQEELLSRIKDLADRRAEPNRAPEPAPRSVTDETSSPPAR